MYFLHTNYVWR